MDYFGVNRINNFIFSVKMAINKLKDKTNARQDRKEIVRIEKR